MPLAWKSIAGVLLALALAVAGCGGDDEAATAPAVDAEAAFPTVGVDTVAGPVRKGTVLLVDVREPEEWTAGHAPRAKHVPLGEVTDRLEEIRSAANGRPVAFICRSGNRSAQAAEAATDAGLQQVSNVDGGMGAWEAAGLPLVPADGRII